MGLTPRLEHGRSALFRQCTSQQLGEKLCHIKVSGVSLRYYKHRLTVILLQ
uniref:Uncharacterized protein n=1 Tax=Anguilla anguilla TaxID=7936 RepID=A0A0E9VVI5_ANGAN